jgi:glucosyl-3-phosphoglycerate synthase
VRRDRHATQWPAEDLVAGKGTNRVSVVIPARDEEVTIGRIVHTIRQRLVEQVLPVDELLVVDSCSQDRTARVAVDAGASVVAKDDVLRHLPLCAARATRCGKGSPRPGATSWCSLTATCATSPSGSSPDCSANC